MTSSANSQTMGTCTCMLTPFLLSKKQCNIWGGVCLAHCVLSIHQGNTPSPLFFPNHLGRYSLYHWATYNPTFLWISGVSIEFQTCSHIHAQSAAVGISCLYASWSGTVALRNRASGSPAPWLSTQNTQPRPMDSLLGNTVNYKPEHATKKIKGYLN